MKLGQHFLKSKSIVKKIVKLADIKKTDVVLEVGPGKGALTKELLKYAKKLIGVEKDERFVNFLSIKFNFEIKQGKLMLLCGDILKISNFQFLISKQIQNPKSKILNSDYKIVANIPYYITSKFLRNVLLAKNPPKKMVLMVQKEVGERICAKPPKMNMLAILTQAFGKPVIAFRVKKEYFAPKPKVDSAVIAIDEISHAFFQPFGRPGRPSENEFFDLAKTGFSHKRKLLINNLAKIAPKEELETGFKKCGIPLDARAQELSLENWKCLSLKHLTSLKKRLKCS